VPLKSICAGRTDAGVHALNQVIHFDTEAERALDAWVRGTNRYLPGDIAVQWCRFVPASFHSRATAIGRRYDYLLLESPVRPALESGLAGWTFRPLDGDAMRRAGQALVGEHDFSAFRSSECQALSPVKTMRDVAIERRGAYWRFRFDADAFLHHMIRNIVGCLVAVGSGVRSVDWLAEVLDKRDRSLAAATFAPDGLYFVGPYYDAAHGIPDRTAAMDWLP
jgi:tRNA pseudouridine38-40 synthase